MTALISVANLAQLETILAADPQRLVAIMFTTSWCGHCNEMMPFYEKLASTHPRVACLLIDCGQQAEIKRKYNMMTYPTFLFLRNLETISTIVGDSKEDRETITKMFTAR